MVEIERAEGKAGIVNESSRRVSVDVERKMDPVSHCLNEIPVLLVVDMLYFHCKYVAFTVLIRHYLPHRQIEDDSTRFSRETRLKI